MGRRPRSSPSGREARAWRRGPACKQPTDWNAGRTLVNTDEPDDALSKAERRVLEIQTKLHRWASDDPHRRFDDLYNLVCDPAFLLVGWSRVRSNKGARTAGMDGETAHYIEDVRGLEGFLEELRADLKDRTFQPLPVRQRAIPKAGGKVRYLGIATVASNCTSCSSGLGWGVRWAESATFWRQAASTWGPKGTHQRPAGVRRAVSWPCWIQW